MPFQQLLPSIFPQWETGDSGWPAVQSAAALLGADVSATDELRKLYNASIGNPNSVRTLTLLTGGAGFLRPDWANVNGTICMVTAAGAFPSAMYFGQDYVFFGPLDDAVLSVKLPETYRVNIKEFYVSWGAAAPNILNGDKPVIFLPTDGGAVTNVDVSGILGAQYGLRGKNGNALEWFVTVGGVLQETAAIVWPEAADFRNWVKVTCEHVAATPALAAKFNLYLNDSLVIARDWESGTVLPRFSDAVTGTGCMMRSLFYKTAVASDQFAMAMIRSREGAFDVAGTVA